MSWLWYVAAVGESLGLLLALVALSLYAADRLERWWRLRTINEMDLTAEQRVYLRNLE